MSKTLAVVLLAIGVTMVYQGYRAAHAFGSSLTYVFTGSPSNNSVWLLAAGAIIAAAGLSGLARWK